MEACSKKKFTGEYIHLVAYEPQMKLNIQLAEASSAAYSVGKASSLESRAKEKS